MEESKVYNLDGFEATAFLPPNAKIQEPKPSKCCGPCCGKKCCCCITSWKCCGIVTGITLLIIGLLLGMAAWSFHKRIQQAAAKSKEMQKGASEWENRLSSDTVNLSDQDLITGNYQVVSYDKNYEKYLAARGIPSFIIPFVLIASEDISITKTAEKVVFATKKEGNDDVKVDIFKYGEITEVEYGSRKKGILHTNCTNPMLNVILCEMEEKDMSYTLLDRFEFFHDGFVKKREHVTKGIKAKKYYQRQGIQIGDNTFGTNQEDVVVIPTYEDDEEYEEDPFSAFDDN